MTIKYGLHLDLQVQKSAFKDTVHKTIPYQCYMIKLLEPGMVVCPYNSQYSERLRPEYYGKCEVGKYQTNKQI